MTPLKYSCGILFPSVLLFACKPGEEATHDMKTPSAETSVESSLEILVTDIQKLEGTEWLLIDLCDRPMGGDHTVTLAISEEGRVSGNASVNRYSGPIKLEDGVMEIGPFMSTRMAGPPEAMETENEFLEALSAAQNIRMTVGSQLIIPVHGRDQPLRFRAAE